MEPTSTYNPDDIQNLIDTWSPDDKLFLDILVAEVINNDANL